MTHTIIFDFDSTIIRVESLDEIIRIALEDGGFSDGQRTSVMTEIERITNLGMAGEIDLSESIARRLASASVHQKHVRMFCERLSSGDLFVPGMPELIRALLKDGQQVMVISGGLLGCLNAVAPLLTLLPQHLYANTYTVDDRGIVMNVDHTNPLSTTSGKSVLIKQLKEKGIIAGRSIIVGDGMSDFRPFEQGSVDAFIGFGGVVKREEVAKRAPKFVENVVDLAKVIGAAVHL